MHIHEKLEQLEKQGIQERAKGTTVSFEFFPPKHAGRTTVRLLKRIERMAKLMSPLFINITCNAAKAEAREEALSIACSVQNYLCIDVMLLRRLQRYIS